MSSSAVRGHRRHVAQMAGSLPIPIPLTNLKIWLKADVGTYQDAAKTTPAVANNDPIGGWVDQAPGGGAVLAQATAGKRPLLKLANQNGLPTVTFDGVDDFLQKLYGTPFGQPLTIFLALNDRSSAAANTYLFDDATASALAFHYATAGTLLLANAGTNVQYAETFPTGFTVYTIVYNGASSLIRRDRVQKAAANAGGNSQSGLTLAAAFNGTQSGLIDYGEILIYIADMTAQFATIEGYLKTRWGTP